MEPTPPYVSEIDASLYLAGRPNIEAWTSATPEQRLGALIEVSDQIDDMRWKGLPLTIGQARTWPRSGVDMYHMTVLKRAVILEAVALLEGAQDTEGQQRAKLQAQGVKAFSLGSLSESYGGETKGAGGFNSESAYKVLRPYMVTSGRVV